jgi:hypothetical protein
MVEIRNLMFRNHTVSSHIVARYIRTNGQNIKAFRYGSNVLSLFPQMTHFPTETLRSDLEEQY